MIGIIGAMDVETDGIKALMKNASEETVSGIKFVTGEFSGKNLVVAKCGAGKVNAALCTEAMILKFNPECIINTGVAGGLAKELNVTDIAIAENVVQHDYDTTPLGEPLGFLSHINIVNIPCSQKVIGILRNAAQALPQTTVICGTIATGDQFINSREQKLKIIHDFNAVSAEMEGGAIGHVCYANSVDFGVLRAISDNADGSSHMDFKEFTIAAADKTVKIIKYFIENY